MKPEPSHKEIIAKYRLFATLSGIIFEVVESKWPEQIKSDFSTFAEFDAHVVLDRITYPVGMVRDSDKKTVDYLYFGNMMPKYYRDDDEVSKKVVHFLSLIDHSYLFNRFDTSHEFIPLCGKGCKICNF
eukprot:719754-Hanusia_phi.AAC.2